jgi:O-succinylbenzoate synthase
MEQALIHDLLNRYSRRGGSGNKFVLEIPTSEIVEYEPTRVLAQDINALRSNILQGARILVIEDDEVAAVVIKSMLIRLGARPEVAFGSSVSLRELEDTLTRNFDAAICGLDVPSLGTPIG